MRNRLLRIIVLVLAPLFSASLFSCLLSSQPPRFRVTHDLQMNSEIRDFPVSRELVWKCVRAAAREDYRLLREDKGQGLILTQWRKKKIRGTGRMSAQSLKGVKIEPPPEMISRNEMGEFDLRNRLYIIVLGNENSSTVSVTNFYLARPRDDTLIYLDPEFVEVDYVIKAFPMSDFDTREQYRFLNQIGEMVKNKRK